MGIIINDTITLPSGLQVTGAYAGFGSQIITVVPIDVPTSPNGKNYIVSAPYNIYVSNATRLAGAEPLLVQQLSFTMGPQDLMDGVYAVLYAQMCAQYASTTNTDTPVPTAPSSSTQTTGTAATTTPGTSTPASG